MNNRASRVWSSILFAVALAIPFQPARAELIATDQVASAAQVQADREKIRAFLNRADAERSLVALGVKPELAKQRVDALTDAEVVSLAGKIDTLPAGGYLSNTDVIIILLVAILVALLI